MSFPESSVPLNGEPLMTDHHPVQRAISIYAFHSKSPTGLFLNNPLTDLAMGQNMRELVIAGSGIYVVDCPLGWPGKLRLNNDVEYEIFPGAVIPDRYSRVTLVGAPAPTSGLVSDSPIVLALGPRGGDYRRPGWRYHLWHQRITGYDAVVVPPGDGPLGTSMLTRGYDFWCGLVSIATLVAGNSIGITVEHTSLNGESLTPSRLIQISDIFPGASGAFYPAWGTGPYYNLATGEKAPVTMEGQTTFDYRLAGGITGNPSMPHAFGWAQLSTAFLLTNRAGINRTFSLYVVGAVRVN